MFHLLSQFFLNLANRKILEESMNRNLSALLLL